MRCTGGGSDDCCAAFENGTSMDRNCTQFNFVANEQSEFTCSGKK